MSFNAEFQTYSVFLTLGVPNKAILDGNDSLGLSRFQTPQRDSNVPITLGKTLNNPSLASSSGLGFCTLADKLLDFELDENAWSRLANICVERTGF